MSWTRLMLTAFAALIIVIGAGSLGLVLADLSFLKPTVENYVRSITGRDFAIANSDWAAAERGTAITGVLRLLPRDCRSWLRPPGTEPLDQRIPAARR